MQHISNMKLSQDKKCFKFDHCQNIDHLTANGLSSSKVILDKMGMKS